MEFYEAETAMEYSYYASKDSWEQARFIAHSIYQVNSRKRIALDKFCPFAWEEEGKEDEVKAVTREDAERLKKLAEDYINKKNGKSKRFCCKA